jgi:hypothetical protein
MRAALFVSLVAVVFSLTSFQQAKGETLMQCMEKCIQYEGGNSSTNKDTCKSRCGAAQLKKQPAKKQDCFGTYKACKKPCGKEKIGKPNACHQACKATLMTCN